MKWWNRLWGWRAAVPRTPNADGPDVSHWNTVSNEAAFPSFGMASCKLGGQDKPGLFLDPTCPAWLARFRARQIPRIGVFYWLRSDITIAAQFAHMVDGLRRVGLDVGGKLAPGHFIQIDWEVSRDIANLTVPQVEHFTRLIADKYGDRQIMYSAEWVPGFVEWRKRNPTFPLWYANFNLTDPIRNGWVKTAQYRADVWQWTDKYPCPGMATSIDMNHVFNWSTLDRISTPEEEEMKLSILGRDADRSDPHRWVTNDLVRVLPTVESIGRLVAQGKVTPGQDIEHPEWVSDEVLKGIPLVPVKDFMISGTATPA